MAKREPMLGAAFNPETMNESGRIAEYVGELQWYRPRGFSALVREGYKLANAAHWHDKPGRAAYRGITADDIGQLISEWFDSCDSLLTEYADRCGFPYHVYGPFDHGGAIGYHVNVNSALEDSDLRVSDTSDIPPGFVGMVVHVNDHGNVTAYACSKRKRRELFAVV